MNGLEYYNLEEFNKYQNLLKEEYLSEDEYKFVVEYDPTQKNNFHYIGSYSAYGDYLNLNIYSEHDHEKRQFEMEVGI